MRERLNTYTGYSVGCAAVWTVILLVTRRVANAETRQTMETGCVAWWSGWTSATIARVGYPPPKELGPRGEKALQVSSVPLVALGLGNAIRLIWSGRKRR